MAENETNETLKTPDENYAEAIQKLKENTVNKDEYEKLLKENKQLLDAMVSGKQIQNQTEVPAVKPNIEELRKDLYNDNPLSNLEYVKKTLELRQAIIDDGGVDPFLPQGHNIQPTLDDAQTANRVADVFQHCVDYAEGDSEVFTNELMRLTTDSMPAGFRRK